MLRKSILVRYSGVEYNVSSIHTADRVLLGELSRNRLEIIENLEFIHRFCSKSYVHIRADELQHLLQPRLA